MRWLLLFAEISCEDAECHASDSDEVMRPQAILSRKLSSWLFVAAAALEVRTKIADSRQCCVACAVLTMQCQNCLPGYQSL